ncbi:hypothetical protein ACJ4V0_20345 [Phreatobacter sp. HK31-P]
MLRQLGGEPNFGDATVVSVELTAPSCRVVLSMVAPEASKHLHIEFRFSDVADLQLSRFDNPNVLDALTLREVGGPLVPSGSPPGWVASALVELELIPISGLGGKIVARAVEVSSFTPPR